MFCGPPSAASTPLMPDPRISVIVPLCEGERFIGAALDSVAAQTLAPAEVIVVDDGSTDAGPEIAAARGGVHLVRQQRQGVAAARNAGLAVATGELVAFLDQDDVWLPSKLERQAAALAGDPETAVVLCHMEMLLEPGTARPEWFPARWLEEPQPGYVPSVWLARRSAFTAVGGFDPSFEIACDSDWLARVKDTRLSVTMLEDVLARWRVHGANGSYDRETMGRELMRMMRNTVQRQKAGRDAG